MSYTKQNIGENVNKLGSFHLGRSKQPGLITLSNQNLLGDNRILSLTWWQLCGYDKTIDFNHLSHVGISPSFKAFYILTYLRGWNLKWMKIQCGPHDQASRYLSSLDSGIDLFGAVKPYSLSLYIVHRTVLSGNHHILMEWEASKKKASVSMATVSSETSILIPGCPGTPNVCQAAWLVPTLGTPAPQNVQHGSNEQAHRLTKYGI